MSRRTDVHVRGAALIVCAVLLLTCCSTNEKPEAEPSRASTSAGAPGAVSPAVERQLAATGPGLEAVQAVLVVHSDETVFERYYGTTGREFQNIASVTKSVMSALIGVAIADGDISGVEARLAELLPDHRADMTPTVAATSLGQVLSMTAGLPDDWDGQAGDGWISADDPIGAILNSPVRPPGEQFAYSNTSAHLLGAILEQATGQPLLSYARKKLLDPLGVDTRPAAQPGVSPRGVQPYRSSDFAWPVDSAGLNLGAGLMKLRPRDMANFGSLFLHHGRWHGRQLVPSDWVTAATRQHASAVGLGGADVGYGYMWWVGEVDGVPAFLAWGFGGQVIRVVPSRQLVIVVSTNLPRLDSEGAGFEEVLFLTDDVIAPLFDRQ